MENGPLDTLTRNRRAYPANTGAAILDRVRAGPHLALPSAYEAMRD